MLKISVSCTCVVFAATLALAQTPPPQRPNLPRTQTPTRDTSQKTGTARIRGRVVAADTGQPLKKAQVRAVATDIRENRLTTTDANGIYEIKDMPAGRYQITATKSIFVQLQYGQTRPFEAGKPLEIADGQTVERVDFALPRGSLITGRILDEFGEPTPDVQVSAMRYQFTQGRRQLAPAARAVITNDIGEYRLFGLPPGQYFISAVPRVVDPNRPADKDDTTAADRSGYAPTYYPGTTSVGEAQRVSVDLGQTREAVDLSLVPAQLARISGIAVDSEGKPLPGGLVLTVQASGAGMGLAGVGQIRPDGSFSVLNIAPGEYSLRAIVPQTALAAGATPEMITGSVTVAGVDVEGLRLSGVKSSLVSGTIRLPEASVTPISAANLQLMIISDVPIPMMPPGLGRVNDNFTFEMRIQPGRRFIRLGPQAKGVMLKAVRLNGQDVTDTGIECRTGEDIAGLEIQLTTQQSELSGVVTDSRSQATKDYSVVVFARDSQRWGGATRYFGEGRPDQEGKFRVRNLPPGEYYAIAVDYLEPGSGAELEFLEKMRGQATEFALGDGETKALNLKLVHNVP